MKFGYSMFVVGVCMTLQAIPMNAAPLLESTLKAASEELIGLPGGGGYQSLPDKEAERSDHSTSYTFMTFIIAILRSIFTHDKHHGRSELSANFESSLELVGGPFSGAEHFKSPHPQTHAKYACVPVLFIHRCLLTCMIQVSDPVVDAMLVAVDDCSLCLV